MKKNGIIVIACLLIAAILGGCSPEVSSPQASKTETTPEIETRIPNQIITDVDILYLNMSFEKAVSLSYCVLSAELNEIMEFGGYRELVFTPRIKMKGQMDDNQFHVRQSGESWRKFKIGNEYALVLTKYQTVYEDYDKYFTINDIYIALNSDGSISKFEMKGQDGDVHFQNVDELQQFVTEVTKKAPEVTPIGIPFTRSSKLEDIVEVAQYIVRVKIGEIKHFASDRETYACSVLETFRGDPSKEFDIVFLSNTVVRGNEYYVLLCNRELNKEIPSTLYHHLASKFAIIPADDTGKIEQLMGLLSVQE